MALRTEDRIGLAVAIALHLLLVAALALQFLFVREMPYTSERVSVSLASEVSLAATAPNPAEDSRAALAPEISEEVAPVADADEQASPAEPNTAPQSSTNSPAVTSPERPRSRPDRPRPSPTPAQSANTGGGSRIGENFLDGSGSSTSSEEPDAPAPVFGRRERAALSSAITRQLRRHWTAPSGVDAEKLVSIVSWQLNVDGTLNGRPRCRTVPSSITPSNRPQAAIHCERAINAVRKAAPFNLPEQFYSRWDELEWQFDRRL